MSLLRPKNGGAEDYITRSLFLLIAWIIIGWLPMAALGFSIGLLLNLVTGESNFTTGSALAGMAAYIPLGLLGCHLQLKNYWTE